MAITDHLVMTAMDRLRAGQRQEAAKVCRDILRVEPEHARAHCLLGMISFQEGDAPGALALLEKAATLNDRLPDVPRAQAEVFLGMGEIEKALEAQKRATAMNPRQAIGHLQEAILLQRLERTNEAETAVRRALALKPDTVGAQQLMATLLYRRGELTEAVNLLLAARRAPKPGGDPNHHLALALLALDRWSEMAALPPASASNQVFGETVVAAIATWIAGDEPACREALKRARPLGAGGVEAPNRSVFRTCLTILEGLMAWRADHPQAYAGEAGQTVHVLGDSHVLGYANLIVDALGARRRLESHLVFGCKAWHLVREEPSPHRAFFEAAADRLAPGSTVIAAFGELDCRYSEGIMHTLRKDPLGDWRAMTDALVSRYVAWLVEAASGRGWTLWLASPPMTNVNTNLMGDHECEVFLGIIARFNARLAEEAAGHGLPLVDVHGATRDDNGAPLRQHYIDTNHVRPSALIEAFARL